MSGADADKDLRSVESGRRFPVLLSGARAALLIALLGTALHAFQTIDPFYLRLFEDGEAAFVAGDHAKAVKDLEVAVFGLSADRLRSARSCVYLALSHSSLKNTEKSRHLLRRAVGLIGKDDPGSIGLAGEALNAYERLIENLPAGPDAQPEEAAPPVWEKSRVTTLPPITKPAVDPAQVKKLEGRLGAEPDNNALSLRLGGPLLRPEQPPQGREAHAGPPQEGPRRDHGDLSSLAGSVLPKGPQEGPRRVPQGHRSRLGRKDHEGHRPPLDRIYHAVPECFGAEKKPRFLSELSRPQRPPDRAQAAHRCGGPREGLGPPQGRKQLARRFLDRVEPLIYTEFSPSGTKS